MGNQSKSSYLKKKEAEKALEATLKKHLENARLNGMLIGAKTIAASVLSIIHDDKLTDEKIIIEKIEEFCKKTTESSVKQDE